MEEQARWRGVASEIALRSYTETTRCSLQRWMGVGASSQCSTGRLPSAAVPSDAVIGKYATVGRWWLSARPHPSDPTRYGTPDRHTGPEKTLSVWPDAVSIKYEIPLLNPTSSLALPLLNATDVASLFTLML